MQDFKELDVWKKSVALTGELYRVISRFPSSERFGLVSQIRRASVSVAANIADGWGRGSTGEYIQFLAIARGSLMERETLLIVASNLNFLTTDEAKAVAKPAKDIEKMLNRLIAVLNTRRRAS